jgi:antitoxin VapB
MSEDRAEWAGKTFKSGNSVALRLPKGLGVPEGTEVRMVKEAPMTFRVEPADARKKTIDISGWAGKLPGFKPAPREDFEERPSTIARREAAAREALKRT